MKLIKIQDNFILINDEEIKKGDLFIYPYLIIGRALRDFDERDVDRPDLKKVIAGGELLPEVDFSLLSEEDCKEIRIVNVEKLAESWLRSKGLMSMTSCDTSYIAGFKAALSLNDKQFSLEDMILAYKKGEQSRYSKVGEAVLEKEFIQSLQQKSWEVEVNENNQVIKILQ